MADEIIGVQERAAQRLLQIPGVLMVAVGSKQVAGEPTGVAAIKVFVRRKLPLEDVPPAERIPAEIDGFPTDVVESGEIRKLVDPPGAVAPDPNDWGDTDRYRPLVGGCQISSEVSDGLGTVGCFLRHETDDDKVYGVTNFHVVAGATSPVIGTTKVGQPEAGESCSGCCSSNVGVHQAGALTADRDEAVFKLLAGTRWMAEIFQIGPVAGEAPAVTVDQAQAHSVKVRKRGKRTRLTGGVIIALNGTTGVAENVLVIQPNPNPAAPAGATVFFVYEGDSGSVVVNEANQVLGLIDSRDDAGHGFAFPIRKVLERLSNDGVPARIATAPSAGIVNTVPGSAMVAVPPEMVPALVGDPVGEGADPVLTPAAAPWVPGVPIPSPALMAEVAAELDETRRGCELVNVWLRHQRELLHLVNTNKRVSLAWHRSGGSALVQYVVRMVSDPDLPLPDTLHSRPLAECVDRLYHALRRFGSERLVEDLDRLRATLPNLAGLTYPQVVAALAEER